MYRALEKKSRSVFAIFTPIHDVMCCPCPFIQKASLLGPLASTRPPSWMRVQAIVHLGRGWKGGGGKGIATSNLVTSNL